MAGFDSHPGIEPATYMADKNMSTDNKDAEDAYVTEVDKSADRDISVDPHTLLREFLPCLRGAVTGLSAQTAHCCPSDLQVTAYSARWSRGTFR